MNALDNLKKIIQRITRNPKILSRIDKIAFVIQLLGIQGVSQIALVISKLASDQSLLIQLDTIFSEISSINQNLTSLHNITEQQAQEIKKTLSVVTKLGNELDNLIKEVAKRICKEPKVTFLTKDWSVQKVLDSTFEYDIFSVNTKDHSETHFNNTSAKANQVSLEASGHSKNTLESFSSKGNSGKVDFTNMEQEGKVKINNATITMQERSALRFRSKPRSMNNNNQEPH